MRLDQRLVQLKTVETRSKATDLIKRGLVTVDHIKATKPGMDVKEDAHIEVLIHHTYVSRAGEKLYQAMVDFNLSFLDKVIIDVGSSTGGFTDCALRFGAKKIYAYDVGTDQMDSQLKNDSRVTLREATNILDVEIPGADMVLIDVSFTSVKPIMKHFKSFSGEMLILIKPQFEAGNIRFKKGILKDIKLHRSICLDIVDTAIHLGFCPSLFVKSTLKGKDGNQEYFLYINPHQENKNIKTWIGEVIC